MSYSILESIPLDELPTVEAALVRDTTHRNKLIANPTLSDTAALSILEGGKLEAVIASELYARPLGAQVRDKVLATERRAGPLAAFLAANLPSCEELVALVQRLGKVPSRLVVDLLRFGCQAGPLEASARAARGPVLLNWALHATTEELTATATAELVRTYDSWAPKPIRDAGFKLRVLFERGPEVVQAAVSADSSMVRSVVAGSRSLTDSQAVELLAPSRMTAAGHFPEGFNLDGERMVWAGLAYNPVASLDTVEHLADLVDAALSLPIDNQVHYDLSGLRVGISRRLVERSRVTTPFSLVDDPRELSWLVSRCNHKRPTDGLALLANPALNRYQVQDVARRVGGDLLDGLPSASQAVLRPLVDTALEIQPEAATWLPRWCSGATDEPSRARVVQHPVVPDPHEVWARNTRAWWDEGSAKVVSDRLGDEPRAWQLLLELTPEWSGTIGELLETIEMLTAA
jgi:hypothetical protein